MTRVLKQMWLLPLVAACCGWPALADASQGPGVATGTASPVFQLAMAIVVYGGIGVVAAAGLIGALRSAR